MSLRTEDYASLVKLVAFADPYMVDPATGAPDAKGADRAGMVHNLIAFALKWDDAMFARARIVTRRGITIEPAEMRALVADHDIRPGRQSDARSPLIYSLSIAGREVVVRVSRPALEWLAGGDEHLSTIGILNAHGDAMDDAIRALVASTDPQSDGVYFMTRDWLAASAVAPAG